MNENDVIFLFFSIFFAYRIIKTDVKEMKINSSDLYALIGFSTAYIFFVAKPSFIYLLIFIIFSICLNLILKSIKIQEGDILFAYPFLIHLFFTNQGIIRSILLILNTIISKIILDILQRKEEDKKIPFTGMIYASYLVALVV